MTHKKEQERDHLNKNNKNKKNTWTLNVKNNWFLYIYLPYLLHFNHKLFSYWKTLVMWYYTFIYLYH